MNTTEARILLGNTLEHGPLCPGPYRPVLIRRFIVGVPVGRKKMSFGVI
ncbi:MULTISPECIES: hypothetical protein [Lactococcus]|uniref:Uncharacterized protein n=1 Tax=Lactococcus garvieae TaxID=1363 RepID=A0A1I4IC96_9LACT|nr:hypothetical protein [Lactococcus garvieae]SFL51959.1 hypothetical protein SAMN05216438_11517 [Lactococcus garvieae]